MMATPATTPATADTRRQRRPGALVTLALALALVVAITTAVTISVVAADDDPSASPAYLFVFDGRDAELAPVPGEQGRFTLTVPIERGNQLVTWFTDRPFRDAGHMSMASFVDMWTDSGDDSFTADPPNVAISFAQTTVIATMTDPVIITAPDGGESFESTMTLVKGDALEQLAQSGEHIAAHAKRSQATTLPGTVTLPSVSVFVDDSNYHETTDCAGWIDCYQYTCSQPGVSCGPVTTTKR